MKYLVQGTIQNEIQPIVLKNIELFKTRTFGPFETFDEVVQYVKKLRAKGYQKIVWLELEEPLV